MSCLEHAYDQAVYNLLHKAEEMREPYCPFCKRVCAKMQTSAFCISACDSVRTTHVWLHILACLFIICVGMQSVLVHVCKGVRKKNQRKLQSFCKAVPSSETVEVLQAACVWCHFERWYAGCSHWNQRTKFNKQCYTHSWFNFKINTVTSATGTLICGWETSPKNSVYHVVSWSPQTDTVPALSSQIQHLELHV